MMNDIGYPGRIIPNYVADIFGPLNILIPLAFSSGIPVFGWSGVQDRGGLIGFSLIYGLCSAGIQSLFPATIASLTTDSQKTGVRLGMCFSVVSMSCLTGPPLAGALIQLDHGHYLRAQMWAGTVMTCGGLALVAVRITKVGFAFWKRV